MPIRNSYILGAPLLCGPRVVFRWCFMFLGVKCTGRHGVAAPNLDPDAEIGMAERRYSSGQIVSGTPGSVTSCLWRNTLLAGVGWRNDAIESISFVFGNEAPPAVGLALRRTPSQRPSKSMNLQTRGFFPNPSSIAWRP